MKPIDYSPLNATSLNEHLQAACTRGQLATVKAIVGNPELRAKLPLFQGNGLRQACLHGQLEIVRYLVASPELPYRVNTQYGDNEALKMACKGGHLHVVRYLLTSDEVLACGGQHASIKDGEALVAACEAGHLEIVRYLTTSPELHAHADIHWQNNKPLITACLKGHLDMVKYLCSSGEIVKCGYRLADIHAKNEYATNLPLNAAIEANHLNVVRYLLTDPELANLQGHNAAYRCSFYDTYILQDACAKGYHQMVKFLLSDEVDNGKTIQPALFTGKGFERAFERRDYKMVKILLSYLKKKPVRGLSPVFYEECEKSIHLCAQVDEVKTFELAWKELHNYKAISTIRPQPLASVQKKAIDLALTSGSLGILTSLIVKTGQELHELIVSQAQQVKHRDGKLKEDVQELLDSLSLHLKLGKELPVNDTRQKKMKI